VSPFGAVIAGLIYDRTGNYYQAFFMFAIMSLLVFTAMFLAVPPQKPVAKE
jgi:cyanate permease